MPMWVITRPHSIVPPGGRVYNGGQGGHHSFKVDREAAKPILDLFPCHHRLSGLPARAQMHTCVREETVAIDPDSTPAECPAKI
jgi:hypothetical protein